MDIEILLEGYVQAVIPSTETLLSKTVVDKRLGAMHTSNVIHQSYFAEVTDALN
jgi:hypothetical protein